MVREHMGCVTKYINMTETSSVAVCYPPICTYEAQRAHQSSPVDKPTSCHAATGSSNQAGQAETREVTQLSQLSSLPTGSIKGLKEATGSTRSLNVTTGTCTDVPRGHCQSGVPHPGQTSQLHNTTDVEMKPNHAVVLPTSEDNHRRLSELMAAGVMARSSTLKLPLKVQLMSQFSEVNQMAQSDSVKNTLLS